MASKQEIMNDQRFKRVTKDPRFWEMPEKDRKVKIDKRFRAMFHDKKFKLNYAVDKRGRPISHSTTEDLKRYYELSDSDSDLSDEESKALSQKKMKKKKSQTKTKRKLKNSTGDTEKDTKKTDQKEFENKNDLDVSDMVQKIRNTCKSQKVDSEISLKEDNEEYTQKSTKGKKNNVQQSTDLCLKKKLKTTGSDTTKFSNIRYSQTKERLSGGLERNRILCFTLIF